VTVADANDDAVLWVDREVAFEEILDCGRWLE